VIAKAFLRTALGRKCHGRRSRTPSPFSTTLLHSDLNSSKCEDQRLVCFSFCSLILSRCGTFLLAKIGSFSIGMNLKNSSVCNGNHYVIYMTLF
jgi:hypothetical protein